MTERKSKPKVRRLYHASKISDYQFKKLLASFVADHSAAHTAQSMTLSQNSITAIFAKLRAFLFDYGLFRDPYAGRDPREGLASSGFEEIEHALLGYHLARVAKKHGALDAPLHGPDYHIAESYWRFVYDAILGERGTGVLRPMMEAHVLEFIRRFGPVGSPKRATPEQAREGRILADEQLDRMILWLERNSGKFRDEAERQELRALRGGTPEKT